VTRTTERLQKLGAQMLRVPTNYYQDLGAKWGLDDAELATMPRLNLLHDRDNEGKSQRAYTLTFQDRFFFEVVERQGYTSFGAADAPLRMAAQALGGDVGPIPF
jgi:4-hydroxyphenylpyruvate dioxygenase